MEQSAEGPYMYNSVVLGAHTTVPLYQIICLLSLLSHSSILLALFQRIKTTHNIKAKILCHCPYRTEQ